jgi:hypothetical protein
MQVSTIYSELLRLIPHYDFTKIEEQYQGNRYTKRFTTMQQLITVMYAQIRGLDSLRDIETALNTQKNKWYHFGFKGVKRSTLSDAMNHRSCELFEDLFYSILKRYQCFAPKHGFKFNNPLFSLDSTIIDLCLSIFPWAKYRKRKGAIKLHYLINHNGSLPEFIVMTSAKQHDVKVAQNSAALNFNLLPDSIISFDRAYIDFEWLQTLNKRKVSFVTRAKTNMLYEVVGQHKEIKNRKVSKDNKIILKGKDSAEFYPDELRLVGYTDDETGKYYEFLTNNMDLAAVTIADIYHKRWQIELFFKWIKQNLKIKSFLGTSPNAVMTQVWIAMIYYLILTYIKFQTKCSRSLSEFHKMIREVLLERLNLIDILSLSQSTVGKARDPVLQPSLF